MKDTIRLTHTNKNNLQPFDDDGNRAISQVLGKYAQALIRIDTLERSLETLRIATTARYSTTPSQFVTGSNSSAGIDTSLPVNPVEIKLNDRYWKMFDEHLSKGIEKAQRY